MTEYVRVVRTSAPIRCVAIVLLVGFEPADIAPVQVEKSTEGKAEALEQNAASDADNASPSASERIGKPEAHGIDPTGTEPLDDAITCLARAIDWEARGEGAAGMETVANVVMNRLGHEGVPNTACEGAMLGHEQGSCQFSWWCDGRSDGAREGSPMRSPRRSRERP